jgi:hypothetical protein
MGWANWREGRRGPANSDQGSEGNETLGMLMVRSSRDWLFLVEREGKRRKEKEEGKKRKEGERARQEK